MKKLEVSKKDLKYNLSLLKGKIDSKKTKIIGIVKANGMGLDLIEYSNFLLDNGIQMLAVATVYEAIKLRENNINCKILMLSEVQSNEELEILIKNDITLTIGNLFEKEKIENIAMSQNKLVNAHIKIDTGFGRYGFLYNEIDNILQSVKNTNNIKITGVYTHFSKAINSKYTHLQFDRFFRLISKIKEVNDNIIFHCSNSTAFLLYPEMNLDAVRLRFMYSR